MSQLNRGSPASRSRPLPGQPAQEGVLISSPEPSTAVVPSEPLPEDAEQHARLLQNQYSVDGPERRVAKMTPPLKQKFCEALANGASPTKAAKAIEVARSTVYYQRGIDPQFKEAWADALERAADRYEDRLDELAMESTHPAHVIFQLKNRRPQKWQDRHDVNVEKRSVTLHVALPQLPEQQLLELVKDKLESGQKLLPPPEMRQ